MSNRQTCTDHCDCGQHFHGLKAFDAHFVRLPKRNKWGSKDYDLIHLPGQEVEGLQAWTEDGWCDLCDPTEHPVTVWQVVQSPAQKAWLEAQRQAKATPAVAVQP
jgi:hypothetical protein